MNPEHIHQDFLDLLDHQPQVGIHLDLLEPGTIISVQTVNSVYKLKVVRGHYILIQGGTKEDGTTYFPIETPGLLAGSTWGGSCIKLHWIGKNMNMEIYVTATGTLRTSPVQAATIYYPDGRSEDLWPDAGDWPTNGF